MASSGLDKLLRRESFAPLLRRLIDEMRASVVVEDETGECLLEIGPEEGRGETRHPVMLGGETIGWVRGDGKAAAVVALLSWQAEAEAERRSLASETLTKYKEITFLYEAVERISSCLDTREVARLMIEQAGRVIRFDSMCVLLFDRETGLPEPIASHGDDAAPTVHKGEGIEGAVWASGRAEIVNDVGSDARLCSPGPIASLMCTPLKNNDAVIGLARLSSREPVTYTAEDLKLFSTLASLAATAIENAGLYEQLKEAFFSTVYTLAETIEKRDPYTGNHTRRVMEYSLAIARAMGLAEDEMERLQLAAVLHDVGKIGVRDSVLLKEGPLDAEEFGQIRQHPLFGEQIVGKISGLRGMVPGVKHHHERFDGRGYPDGLAGEAIDITARIIAVADSFDAMTTDRPYRKGLSVEKAFDELRRHAGTQFDPQVVEDFFSSDIADVRP